MLVSAVPVEYLAFFTAVVDVATTRAGHFLGELRSADIAILFFSVFHLVHNMDNIFFQLVFHFNLDILGAHEYHSSCPL